MERGDERKFDGDKLMYDLVFPESIEAMAEILTFGAKKYAPNSWQQLKDGENRYYAALMRHIMAYRKGEKVDSDSGFSHLKHAMTNLAFLLYFEENGANNE